MKNIKDTEKSRVREKVLFGVSQPSMQFRSNLGLVFRVYLRSLKTSTWGVGFEPTTFGLLVSQRSLVPIPPQVEVFGLRRFTRNTSRKSLLNKVLCYRDSFITLNAWFALRVMMIGEGWVLSTGMCFMLHTCRNPCNFSPSAKKLRTRKWRWLC